MKSAKKVSIIIIIYNNAPTIRLCLDAVFRNTYPNYEVLVVDDGSTDRGPEIAGEYDCRILKTASNGGPSVARNWGAEHAAGDILFFIDGDLAIFPEAVENAVKEFEKDEQLGAVCGYHAKDSLIKKSLVKDYRNIQSHYWKKTTEGFATVLIVSVGSIRRDVFFQIGGFNPALRQSEDVEFGERISSKYKILITPKVMGYHDGDDSLRLVLKKLCLRGAARVPLFFERKGFMSKFETRERSIGVVLAFFCLFLLPLGFIHPYLLALPALAFAGFLATDPGLYVYVFRQKSFGFFFYFIFMHLLANLAVFAGLCKGVWEYILGKFLKVEKRNHV